MTTDLNHRIMIQGRALVRAIKATGTIEPSGPFERAFGPPADGRLQAPASCHRGGCTHLGKRGDLSTSEHIRDRRAVLWNQWANDFCASHKWGVRENDYDNQRP